MSKLNLFGKEWNNVVFEGRNKLYGAYKLRQESGKTTFLALALGLGLVGLVFGGTHLYAARDLDRVYIIDPNYDDPVETTPLIEEWELLEPVLPEKTEDQPILEVETKTAMADVRDNKKLTEVIIDKDDKVSENMNAQNQFRDDIQSSAFNTDANLDGIVRTEGGEAGTAIEGEDVVVKKPVESASAGNAIVSYVQVKAMPNEGFETFYDHFSRRFSPGIVSGNEKEIIVRLRFVVEKDGSFTDIRVLNDKHGLGNEAIRVLKTMPKWQPAQHNGTTVRSMFTLPIKIRVNN